MTKRNYAKDILLGVAVGDALGVPVEFITREILTDDLVTGMRAYGSHRQPAGTWSDDSSLSFCLAEMLCGKYNLQDLANRFINWKNYSYWTAHSNVFDIGIATLHAITKLEARGHPILAGGNDEGSNGNGSLMRILPLTLLLKDKNIYQRFAFVKDVSSLTHGHIRAILCCFIYTELALEILNGAGKLEAYDTVCDNINKFLNETATCTAYEMNILSSVLSKKIHERERQAIYSSGYVVHTLEASIWCFLTTDNYKAAVLKAVNLGADTDTTAAVTGGLAALLYGHENIPTEWLSVLARRKDIEDLSDRLYKKHNNERKNIFHW